MIAEVPVATAMTVRLVGLAATAKSWTMYDTETEWVRPLPVPVTVTVYEPAAPEHDNDDVALETVAVRARTEGVRLQTRPLCERATLPTKPSNPVAITVVEPATPARVVTLVDVVVKPKS